MAISKEERMREYPGDRFSKQILEQDLDEMADQLSNESMGEGHLEQGHNLIELYRQGKTTVTLVILDEGTELPEHSVDDGSVMIQILKGDVRISTNDTEAPFDVKENKIVTLAEGVSHTIEATKPSQFLMTIMRN